MVDFLIPKHEMTAYDRHIGLLRAVIENVNGENGLSAVTGSGGERAGLDGIVRAGHVEIVKSERALHWVRVTPAGRAYAKRFCAAFDTPAVP